MKIRSIHIALWTVVALIVTACANMGNPDGGDYDETPPKIVRTTPDFGAIGAHAKKIVLEFNENIKLDNANEKVIVSPPQMEQPDINASGKRITIQLNDSIQEGITYTIDFADAIQDNNEGNPMGDYAFMFSTGETIDTMQVSGYVLDASNLEPIKGIFVGLYSIGDTAQDSLEGQEGVLPDSVFKTKQFERISRTDSRGHFVVKGLKRGAYKAYALKDQDQNYFFSQKSEMIAFNDQTFIPTSKPDLRPDTIWHDSIHYDSIIMRGYTHFFPDDIVLMAFTEKSNERYLLKAERPNLQQFTLFFTNSSDQLPKIEGLNFNAENAFVVENNPTNDTIRYWIRDSLIYNLDTLELALTFMATDTLGQLTEQTDTMELISKISKEKLEKQKREAYEEWAKEYRNMMKQQRKRPKNEDADAEDAVAVEEKEESENATESNEDEGKKEKKDKDSKKKNKKKDKDDDIEVPPMPKETLQFNTSSAALDPDRNFDFIFTEPIDSVNMSGIHFTEMVDSVRTEREFIFRQHETAHHTYRLYAEWQPGHTYTLEIDSNTFVNIYGTCNESFKKTIKVRPLDAYSSLFINLIGTDTCAVVQLMNGNDKVVKTVKAQKGKADFYYINPGTYYLRMFLDKNSNGKWDSGSYDDQIQPEPVYYYPGPFVLRAMWDTNQDWAPMRTPVFRQKPEKITKQKPDKERKIKNRNAERQKNKNK